MASPFMAETPPKSPTVSLVLSLVIPGAGQIYNGDVGKGVALIVGYLVAVGLTVSVLLACVGGPAAIGILIYAVIDAYQTTERLNRELAGPKKQCPYCTLAIPLGAIVCPNCHRDLPTV